MDACYLATSANDNIALVTSLIEPYDQNPLGPIRYRPTPVFS